MQFAECQLRVFTLGSDKLNENLGMFSMFSKNIEAKMESKHMEDCLKNFRISTTDVTTVPNVSTAADPATWTVLREALARLPKGEVGHVFRSVIIDIIHEVSEEEVKAEHTMVNKHLRVQELLQKHSRCYQDTIVLSLIPRGVQSLNSRISHFS